MTATDLTTYEGQVARLNRERILADAESIRRSLFPEGIEEAAPCALNYEPGNGTRYDLHFAPAAAFVQVGSEYVPPGTADHHGDRNPHWTIVSRTNGDRTWAYPVLLTPGSVTHASYVASYTGSGFADACALTALLRAICGLEIG